MLLSIFLGVFLEYSTFDFSEKHTTGIYIWLSVSIRVQRASLPTWQGNCIYLKREISSHKSVPDLQIIEREVCFWQRGRTRISVDGDIEKGRNSDTADDTIRDIDDDAPNWNQLTNSYAVLQSSPDLRSTWYGTTLSDIWRTS